MLRRLRYKLLLSLALPSVSFALGLGDIHVESALHQPLAAQIEIVGVTAENSAGLSAEIADEELFRRHGLERPVALSSTALTVRQDKQGHTVLVLRSTDAFTEPMVTFLVGLHSPSGGEVVREYTVLLDPAGFTPEEHGAVESAIARPLQAAADQTPTPGVTTAPERHATAEDIKPAIDTYTVARRDTLDRIAAIAGAHSRSDRHKMMIAIFRGNPGAFQTNLNILRSGAKLHLPTVAELSKIPADEANHEFAAQMAAWRASDHRVASAVATTPAATTAAPAATAAVTVAVASTDPAPVAAAANAANSSTAVADSKPDTTSREAETTALTQRVASLEKALDGLQQELQRGLKQPAVMQVAAPIAAAVAHPVPAEATAQLQADEDGPAPVRGRSIRFAPIAVSLGLALAAGIWLYRRRRTDEDDVSKWRAERESSLHQDPETPRPFQKIDMSASYLVEEAKHDLEHASASTSEAQGIPAPATQGDDAATNDEPTVKLPTPRVLDVETTAILALQAEVDDDTAAREFAFFNPESAHNTTHVTLASGLDEPSKPFVERRKSPAEALRQAIEREPDRNDLRLKLLELYYQSAAQNRRAFLEAVRQLAKNEKFASPNDWAQIEDMGRAIAPDDDLFSNGRDNKKAVA
jgi:FimV-like protein